MAPAPLSIRVQPHPLTNLSVTSPDKTLSIVDRGSFYDIETVVEGENITITISADGYKSQTVQTGYNNINITLISNTPDISKLSNGTDTYIIRDDVAREAIGNLATVATSGSYNDLSNKPTIPTATSDLTNDSGFITSSALAPYALSADLASVATSGSYNDLSNKPTIPTVNNPTITFTQGGTTKGTITLNQSSDQTIEFDAGGSDVEAFTAAEVQAIWEAN